MDDIHWPRVVNKVVTEKWSQLKNTLVMKDFVDYLIEKRVVTLDYWIGLKSKPISESERTEDFLAQVMKFDQKKYNYFLEALLTIDRKDLVRDLVKALDTKLKQYSAKSEDRRQKAKSSKSLENSRRKDANNTMARSSKSLTPADQYQPPRSVDATSTKSGSDNGHGGKDQGAKSLQNPKSFTDGDQLPEDSPKEQVKSKLQEVKALKGQSGKSDSKTAFLTSVGQKLSAVAADHGSGSVARVSSGQKSPTSKVNGNHDGSTPQPVRIDTKTDKGVEHQPLKGGNNEAEVDNDCNTISESSRPNSAKSREEILSIREEQVKNRETELDEKEKQLKHQEDSLKIIESALLTREHSLTTMEEGSGPQSLPMAIPHHLRNDHLALYDSLPPSASTTQSSDVLADVHEQLKAIRKARVQEIEYEQGSPVAPESPDEQYVKLIEFQVVQKDIEDIKVDIATDREHRQTLQEKIECLKQEIEELNCKVKELEKEKEKNKMDNEKEMFKMKSELKHSQQNHTVAINGLMLQMKMKEDQCSLLEKNMKEIISDADELEKRVDTLEEDKEGFEKEIVRYEKEISDLRRELNMKESELGDLRKVLEDTESEKDDLIEELSDLKKDISTLKSDKRRLEQEKKTLLARCVKPPWSQTSRNSTFR